jgi:hypothetical protein
MKSDDEITDLTESLRIVWSKHHTPKEKFEWWLEETYGIQLILTKDKKKLVSWIIVDEQKYLLFLLETT